LTTQQRISIFKWSIALIAIIVLFLLFRRCGNGGNVKPTTDTVSRKIDTVWLQSKTDTFYTPPIVKTEWRTKLKYKTDTLETTEYIIADTSLILQEYFAYHYYEDTINVKYGSVYINDTVTENKIASRRVRTNFSIPVVKETITLRQPKSGIAYLTFGVKGSDQSFLEQTEVGIAWKAKNEKFYELNGALSRQGILMGGFKIGIPIRLNKK